MVEDAVLIPFKYEAFKISTVSKANFPRLLKVYSSSSSAISFVYNNGDNVATLSLFTPWAYSAAKGIT